MAVIRFIIFAQHILYRRLYFLALDVYTHIANLYKSVKFIIANSAFRR
jgi:hypothetical protein